MPDTGVPTGDAPVAHLATPQWQSFEIRMRARKADRCLQRAAAALADGSIAEAGAALEEARQLAPLHPRLEELSARLNALTQPAPSAVAASAHGYVWTSAAIFAGLVVFGAASWQGWVHRDQIALLVPKAHPDMDTSTGLANPTPGNAAATDVNLAAAPASDAPASSADTIVQTTLVHPDHVIETPATSPQSPPSNEPTAIATAGMTPRNEPKVDAARTLLTANASDLTSRTQREALPAPASPPVESKPAVSLPMPSTPAPPPNFIPSVVGPAAEPSRSINATTSAAATSAAADATPTPSDTTAPALSPSATPPAAVPASLSPARDDRVAVRAALNRYESAYNRLDVDAVRSIWPSLDQRALARAFDNLTSQRVALQNCNVDVSGASARASCSGNASWTPKVGGGERSASRSWTFDLRESNGAWRIVHVQAR